MTDLSHEARVLLAVARRHDGPSEADRRRVAAALASAGAVGASLTGSTTAAAAGVATGVGAAGAKLGSAGAAWGMAALGSKAVVPGLIGLALGAAVVAPVALRSPPAPESSGNAVAVMTASAGESGRPARPPATAPPAAPALAEQAAPGSSSRAGAASSQRAVGSEQPPAQRSASLRDEADLLASVSSELGEGRSKRALELLDDYERRYASGALAEERAAARVFALCQAGQAPAARRHADEFLRTAPRSPLVPRIRSSCAFTEQKSSAGFEPVTEPPAAGHSKERRQRGADP